MMTFKRNVQNRQIYKDRKIGVYLGQGVGTGVTVKECQVSLGDDESVLKLAYGYSCSTLQTYKIITLYISNGYK